MPATKEDDKRTADEKDFDTLVEGNEPVSKDQAKGADGSPSPEASGLGALDGFKDDDTPSPFDDENKDKLLDDDGTHKDDTKGSEKDDDDEESDEGEDKKEKDADSTEDDKSGDAGDEKLDEALIARAKAVGLENDVIARLYDGGLEGIVEKLESTDGKPKAGADDDKSGGKTEDSKDGGKKGYKVELDPEEFGQEVVDTIQGVTDHFESKYAVMEEKVLNLQNQYQRASETQAVRELDEQLGRLGENELFGKGPTLKMKRNSAEYEERMKFREYIGRHVVALAEDAETMSLDEIVDSAFAAKYSSRRSSQTTKQIGQTMRTRKNGNVPRAAHHDREAHDIPAGEGKAVAEIEAYQKAVARGEQPDV